MAPTVWLMRVRTMVRAIRASGWLCALLIEGESILFVGIASDACNWIEPDNDA